MHHAFFVLFLVMKVVCCIIIPVQMHQCDIMLDAELHSSFFAVVLQVCRAAPPWWWPT